VILSAKTITATTTYAIAIIGTIRDTTLAILCNPPNITKAVRAAKIMAAIYEFIPNEAKEVLNAYFSEIGESKNKAFLQIKAFAVLSFLRELYFQVWQKQKIDYSEKDRIFDIILNCGIEDVLI